MKGGNVKGENRNERRHQRHQLGRQINVPLKPVGLHRVLRLHLTKGYCVDANEVMPGLLRSIQRKNKPHATN